MVSIVSNETLLCLRGDVQWLNTTGYVCTCIQPEQIWKASKFRAELEDILPCMRCSPFRTTESQDEILDHFAPELPQMASSARIITQHQALGSGAPSYKGKLEKDGAHVLRS